MMNDRERAELAKQWSDEGRRYVQAVNEMLRFAREHGWKAWSGQEPEDRRDLATANRVLELLRDANIQREFAGFREEFPPAHGPFIESLDERGTRISQLVWIDADTLAFVVGAPGFDQQGYMLSPARAQLTALEDVRALGVSADGYFARASSESIVIHNGWDGPLAAELPWPSAWNPDQPLREVSSVLVLPGGTRVLVVTGEGIFLATESSAKRIHPVAVPDAKDWHPYGDMAHAAVAPDGGLICVGHQSSVHRVLDANGDEVASIGRASSYPHHAAFSRDGSLLAMNSCHFYNGMTIAVPTAQVRGMKTPEYVREDNWPAPCQLLDDVMRVYASAALPGMFLLGDANGYVRAVRHNGEQVWEHYVGSTISGLAISPDDRTLAIGSTSGTLHIVALDQDEPDPFQIGNGNHVEQLRILFWKDQPQPLFW